MGSKFLNNHSTMAAAEHGGVGRGANMSMILSLLGIAVAAAGVAAIGFGIPINEFTLGTTLIVAGVSALTGGLVLIGLAAVVSELGRLGEALRARPVTRPAARSADTPELAQPAAPVATIPTPGPIAGGRSAQAASPRLKLEASQVPAAQSQVPASPSALDASAATVERLHSSTPQAEQSEPSIVADEEEVPLSPSAATVAQAHRRRVVDVASSEPKVSPEDRTGGAAVEALKASRLDFLFRSKPARPASQRENFDAVWPAPGKRAETGSAPTVEAGQADQAAAEYVRTQSAPREEPRTAAILKSGVVDGMAYTLYTDGSIEAKLPHETVKFGSIAELRAHIESNS